VAERHRRPRPVATRAGNSTRVLHDIYTHCISGHDDTANQQIERALRAHDQPHQRKASGPPNRRYPPIPVRYMSVTGPHPAVLAVARHASNPGRHDETNRIPAAQHQ
jgi:hypothetical protein